MALGSGDAPSAAPAATPPGRGAGHGGPQAALATRKARRARHAAPADTTDGRVRVHQRVHEGGPCQPLHAPSRVPSFSAAIDDPCVCPREGMSPLYTTRALLGYGPLVSA